MNSELEDAKRRLQAAGLTVRTTTEDSLWIAGHLTELGDGLRLSHDACALMAKANGEFVGVFPSLGHMTIEVPGSIPDLTFLILATYLRHRELGGEFPQAVGVVLRDAVPSREAVVA